jgi:ribosomal protein S6--L-glutamate ligase
MSLGSMNRSRCIGVLGAANGWYMRDLQRAASELNALSNRNIDIDIDILPLTFDTLSVQSLDTLDVRSVPAREGVATIDVRSLDALFVRTMPLGSLEQVIFRMNALHVAKEAGTRVLNPPRCLEVCIDKWLTIQKARSEGLLTPRTICCQTRDEALHAWNVLGEDCIVKPIFGGEGRGIVRVQEYDMAWRVFSTLEQLRSVIYIQEFVRNDGTDLRLLVLGEELYCVRRDGGGNWKANVSQGGTAARIEPTFEQADIAYRAAKIVGGWMVGVDVIEDADGRNVLIEVNAVPGWRATAAAVEVDIAKRMLELATQPSNNMPQ